MAMDTSDCANLSELESLSDSDWLDIASSKASEDNESLDGDDEDRPLSRISHVSSTDDSPIAWEGYAEESSEDDDELGSSPFVPRSAAQVAAVCSSPLRETVEDKRVRDALDQSMMSTLSASRSSSFGRSSIHTPRDLRLSFPDPISSSRDTLHKSYENVDSSDFTPPPSSDHNNTLQVSSKSSAPSEDPGSSSVPEVFSDQDTTSYPLLNLHDLHIVLYGFSTQDRWTFIDQLLDRVSRQGHPRNTSEEIAPSVRERKLNFQGDVSEATSRLVAVIDKTGSSDAYPRSDLPFDRPSIGVVFLPNSIASLPAHTRYLPLIPPMDYTNGTPNETVLRTAEDKWEKFGISRKRLLLNDTGKSPIMERNALLKLEPSVLAHAFHSLSQSVVTPVPQEHPEPVHKVAGQSLSPRVMQLFFALTCALVGCVIGVNRMGTSQVMDVATTTESAPSITDATWIVNNSDKRFEPPVIGPTPTDASTLIPSSLKDFALTVFNPPGSLSVVESHSPQTPQPSSSGSMTYADSSNACTDIIHSTKDIVPLSFSREKASSILSPSNKGKRRETAEDILYELSLQLSRSLSRSLTDLIDLEFIQAIAESLGKEVKDILVIIEELVLEIKSHGIAVWENPSNAVQVFRTRIREKNDVAKKNARRKAKEFSQMGERLLGHAIEVWKENRELARERAIAINKRIFKSEAWLMHEQESNRRAIPLGI